MASPTADSQEVQKIHTLLAAKDDTSRFVGLLLLKTTLDKHASELQHGQVKGLWDSISPRFLDRLIRTGSRPASEQQKQSGDMLAVAVAVLYTFTKLLNNCALDERFYGRIPNLANAVLYSSKEVTQRILDLINTLVQQPAGEPAGGATRFAELEVGSWTPLIEIAPQHKDVFSIFYWSWINGSKSVPTDTMMEKISEALQLFISSFKGQYPAPLLDFIAMTLENLPPHLRSPNPSWLRPLARLVKDMASNKPTEESRRAYILCASSMLTAYPETAPKLLFSDEPRAPKPISYLFVKMVQVDVLSTLHVLIPKVNTAEYPSLSRRIAGALDIMTSFVGFLITVADDETAQPGLTPDQIIKLHEDLAKMVGDVMEYLHDRWEDFQAGSRGIESTQSSKRSIFEDAITPAAIRFIATWLRDDDGETLRSQAAGLTDLFAELYKMNLTSPDTPELRLPMLAAFEGILQTSKGREAFNEHEVWSRSLYSDLRAILSTTSSELTTVDYMRGSALIHTFLLLMEYDNDLRSHPAAESILDSVASMDIQPAKSENQTLDHVVVDFQIDALELASVLLRRSSRNGGSAHDQKTITSLKNVASKVSRNSETLNDKSMAARINELHLG
ncbi:DUF1941-domain-containing protein [Poronia punctata]|nr:DUF1941-domain-containing protein [Poronia punctata]